MLAVLPREQVQRRTVEQIVDPVLEVPMLPMVMPQMVEQLVDILTPLDFPVPEQVFEVPKIVCLSGLLAQSLVRRRRWNSCWKRPRSCLFSRSWSRSPTFQFLIMVSKEGFKVFTQDRVQQRVRSRSCRFLNLLLGKSFKGFFALERCAVRSALGVGTECGLDFWEDEFGGMWMLLPSGRWYLLCSDPEVFLDGPG